MLAKTKTAAIVGLSGIPVSIEVDISPGLPGMTVVGLPSKSVDEAKERVRAALHNSGFKLPARRIIINLAPADIKKEGSHFDLSIAIAILKAQGIIKQDKNIWLIGELGLKGDISHSSGVLPMARAAQRFKADEVLVPFDDSREAALVDKIKVVPVTTLHEAVEYLNGGTEIPAAQSVSEDSQLADYEYDFAYVKGQDRAKRAMEIARLYSEE